MALTTSRVAPPVSSPAHAHLLQLIRSRRALSERAMSKLKPGWRTADRLYRHYVDPGETDREGKRLYPWARDIVVPLTFAIVQTQLAWEMAAFTQRVPVVPLDGLSPEDVKPAKVMEQVLQHEWLGDRMALSLYQWLLDRRRYGLGVLWVNYVRDITRQYVERPQTLDLPLLGLSVPIGTKATWEDRVRYEGNRLDPVDPYSFFPDPRVSLGECHKGEYVGYRTQRHYHDLLLRERDGQYANVQSIPRGRRPLGTGEVGRAGGFGQNRLTGSGDAELGRWLISVGPNTLDAQEQGTVDLDVFVIRIIPKDYELSGSTMPEKYVVVVANDGTVLRAQPYEFDHDELPACVMQYTPDRHYFSSPGVVEHLEDLSDYLSWLWNSHAQNVRRSLNNQWIVDPSLIEIQDLLAPQPGLLARLRREAQGRPGALEQAIKQFPVIDVTKTHMSDMDLVINMTQRVAAAPENLQGILAEGERTLGEQQMAVTAAQGRLKLEAQMAWLEGMTRCTYMRVSNLQQFTSEERWIRIVGTYARALGVPADTQFLRVGPEEVQGAFQYAIPDFTVRSDQAMLMAMRELFLAVAKDPELRQRFDIVKLFELIAQQAGVRDIQEYQREMPAATGQVPIPGMPSMAMPGMGGGGTPPGLPPPAPGAMANPRVLPDEQVLREVEKGNLVPA